METSEIVTSKMRSNENWPTEDEVAPALFCRLAGAVSSSFSGWRAEDGSRIACGLSSWNPSRRRSTIVGLPGVCGARTRQPSKPLLERKREHSRDAALMKRIVSTSKMAACTKQAVTMSNVLDATPSIASWNAAHQRRRSAYRLRPQALDGFRLCRNREPALLLTEHPDALRRRQSQFASARDRVQIDLNLDSVPSASR